ncbi:hypothetical protein BH09VER1_BH09VER1_38410 [soil metagenome]
MKTAFSLLALIATIGLAQAGNFGGPPPFTNGSPLTSGVDGSYSGNVTAGNTIGIIRFVYSGNVQTTSTTDNSYSIFTEGLTFQGDDQVSITPGSIVGVLDRNSTAGFDLSSAMTGDFSASMDMNSAYGTFTGKGTLQIYFSPTGDGLTFVTWFSKSIRVKGARTSTGTASS